MRQSVGCVSQPQRSDQFCCVPENVPTYTPSQSNSRFWWCKYTFTPPRGFTPPVCTCTRSDLIHGDLQEKIQIITHPYVIPNQHGPLFCFLLLSHGRHLQSLYKNRRKPDRHAGLKWHEGEGWHNVDGWNALKDMVFCFMFDGMFQTLVCSYVCSWADAVLWKLMCLSALSGQPWMISTVEACCVGWLGKDARRCWCERTIFIYMNTKTLL